MKIANATTFGGISYLGGGGGGSIGGVDLELSDSSSNPIANKAVYAALAAIGARLSAIESGFFGTLTVTLTGTYPPEAAWSVDGGDSWHAPNLPALVKAGSYTVAFKAVAGWSAPANQLKQVVEGGTVNVTAAYVANGTIMLTFTGTVPEGAGWMVDGGSYSSGDVASLPPGTYTVTFAAVSGYSAPSSQTVTVQSGQPTSLTAEYTEQQQPSGPGYAVSGSSSYNGTYTLSSSITGYGGSPAYEDGSGNLLVGVWCSDDDEAYWALMTTSNWQDNYAGSSGSRFYPPSTPCIRISGSLGSSSTPPLSGWMGGVSLTQVQ